MTPAVLALCALLTQEREAMALDFLLGAAQRADPALAQTLGVGPRPTTLAQIEALDRVRAQECGGPA
jgi:hypothetical protein